MHPYSFIVSLRANHPSRDLRFLSDIVKSDCRNGWTAGDEHVTPKATNLGGTRAQSYWSARITAEETSSEERTLEDVLEESIAVLELHKEALQDLIATGGAINYFVGLFGLRNFGLVLTPELMSRLASAGVELQLDVFPPQSAA